MKKILFSIIIVLFFLLPSEAKTSREHLYFESDYQRAWCEKNCGQTEVVLFDKARVDCVTKTHAVEFDFAPKWAESIGQALYYGEVLKKNSGIVLIVEDKIKDKKYIDRVKTVCKKHCITLWLMYPEDINY